MKLDGTLPGLRQDLINQLETNSKNSENAICHGEQAKKASRIMQNIICGEKETILAVHTQTGWIKNLG